MTPDEKHLLETVAKQVKENRKLLRKIRRHMALGTAFRFMYWFVIIGTAVGLFYYFQPYIDNVVSIYSGLSDTVNTFQSLL